MKYLNPATGAASKPPETSIHVDRDEKDAPDGAATSIPTSLLPGVEISAETKKRPSREPRTEEQKAFEAEARAIRDELVAEYERVTGHAPENGVAEIQIVRGLLRRHGRATIERAAAAMFSRHRADTLKWSGRSKAPTIRVLKAMWDDLVLDGGAAHERHDPARELMERVMRGEA